MLILFFANALCSALSFQILGLYPELYHCNRNVSFIMLTERSVSEDQNRLRKDFADGVKALTVMSPVVSLS